MKDCITHHYACDCREAKFKEMEAKLMTAEKELAEVKAENEHLRNIAKTIKYAYDQYIEGMRWKPAMS